MVEWDREGRVHRGFLKALDAVWTPLQAHLHELEGRSLWLTGHGLGAALAVLAAHRCAASGLRPAGVYTIGSPAVGDQAFTTGFRTALDNRCFRYINGRDGVTRLPPEE